MKRDELKALLFQAAQEHWAGERLDAMLDMLMALIDKPAKVEFKGKAK